MEIGIGFVVLLQESTLRGEEGLGLLRLVVRILMGAATELGPVRESGQGGNESDTESDSRLM